MLFGFYKTMPFPKLYAFLVKITELYLFLCLPYLKSTLLVLTIVVHSLVIQHMNREYLLGGRHSSRHCEYMMRDKSFSQGACYLMEGDKE